MPPLAPGGGEHRAWQTFGDGLLALSMAVHLWVSPFAKVEESFNLQAVHDLLVRRWDLGNYDHLEFPGVVPRTFIGASAVAFVAWPLHFVRGLLGLPLFHSQLASRAALGVLFWAAFRKFRAGVASRLGGDVGACLGVVTAVQFHLPFYATRTLPNTLALVVLLLAYAQWFDGRDSGNFLLGSGGGEKNGGGSSDLNGGEKPEPEGSKPERKGRREAHQDSKNEENNGGYACIAFMTAAAVVFRCDVLVLAAPAGLSMLLTRRVTFLRGVAVGLAALSTSLAATVCLDSVMWRRPLWPEGEVFFFNAVENKSSAWGTLPAHWYFTSALPRALLATALLLPASLAPLGQPLGGQPLGGQPRGKPGGAPAGSSPRRAGSWLDVTVLPWLAPALGSVALYSALPHKELRFVFPALPLINAAAAHGLAKLLSFASSSSSPSSSSASPNSPNSHGANSARPVLLRGLAGLLALGALGASLGAAAFLAHAASWNYPGGHALAAAHRLLAPAGPNSRWAGLRVHIDAAAAMTGVSRFGELHRDVGWTYSKAENLTAPGDFVGEFDVLVTAKSPEWFAAGTQGRKGGIPPFVVVHTERGFDRVGLLWAPPPPWLLERLPSAVSRPFAGAKFPFLGVQTTPKINVLASSDLVRDGACNGVELGEEG